MFAAPKRKLGCKLESTPYSAETLTGAHFDTRVYNITYGPEIAEFKRKYATNDFASFTSVMGKQKATFGFFFDLAPHQTGGTNVPEWDRYFKSCGWKQTVETSGVSWAPSAEKNYISATFEIRESQINESSGAEEQLTLLFKGCMGNLKIVVNEIGEPMHAECEYQGAFVSITDDTGANVVTPSGFNTAAPDAVLSSTITAFTDTLDLNSVTVDPENELGLAPDPSAVHGIRGAYVVDRGGAISFDPHLKLLADSANYTRWVAGTTGTFSMTAGSGATMMTLTAPAIQITKAYDGADRDKFTVNTITGILTRTSDSVEEDVELLQGSKT